MVLRRDIRRNGHAGSQVSGDLQLLSRFAPRQSKQHVTPQGGGMEQAGGAASGKPVSHGESLSLRLRSLSVMGLLFAFFVILSGQLVSLALRGQAMVTTSMSSPLATAFARPDIVDRNGRLIATDVVLPSLFADPAKILDRDEVVETLKTILPDLNEKRLRKGLSDKKRRFLWIRRGLSTGLAQKIHDAGLPGLSFRFEMKRAYPLGRLAGHFVGGVDYTNRGISGIEKYLDDHGLVEPVHGVAGASGLPVRLSLDVGVQFALEEELSDAMKRFGARAASGVVLNILSGEIVGAASLPGVDPMLPVEWKEEARRNRLSRGAFELGSIFKLISVAMALEAGKVRPDTMVDITKPLVEDGYSISDSHGAARPISVRDVFVRSSNVGAGILGLEVGAEKQKAFLEQLGLLSKLRTEAGPVEPPRGPKRWGRIETVTVSYGHGLAIAPLQFAAGAAALLNGGKLIRPTFLRDGSQRTAVKDDRGLPRSDDKTGLGRVVSPKTSQQLRIMMRANVTDPKGTGRRADVRGYRVGGKTGTAELPGRGGYKKKSVISSFLAAFPMDAPRYVVLVSLFEPQATRESGYKIVASRNAAPVAGRIISRIGPMLGVRAVFE